MKLKIGNFHVKDVVFGSELSYRDGVLVIDKEKALNFVRQDAHITEAELYIVKPGDMVRLFPVKEAVEPRMKMNGTPLFPGYTGPVTQAGEGETKALKNCSVLAVGKHWGGFQDGLIDMGGVGAKYTYFSGLINIVLVADTDEIFEQKEQQKKNKALRQAVHKLAEYLAGCLKELTTEDWDEYEFRPAAKRSAESPGLPTVVYVMQLQSQMEEEGYNDLVYGWNTNHMVPTFMNPNEILNGAVVSGSFMPCSSKWSTYDLQNAPVIRRLFEEDGKTLNFLGVILSNLNVALEQKERSVLFVTELARSLGADAAIVAEEGYGNPDADFVACIAALEDAGVKTVGITNECTGRDGQSQPLVSLDEKLTAIVSCGNVSELIELPPMPVVLGELKSLARDGVSGGWSYDENLGPSVRRDGSVIMENNAMFCGDQVLGWSRKTMLEY